MILLLLFISIYLVSGLDHVEIKTPPVVIGDKRGPNTLLDFMNGDSIFDAGFTCHPYSVADIWTKVDAHIIEFEPVASKLVHHMDVFECSEKVVDEYAALKTRKHQSNWCTYDMFLESSCKKIIMIYDKGADGFKYPPDVGILVGPSSGFSHVLLQIHYLLPESGASPILDESGFNIVLDTQLRQRDARMFALCAASTLHVPKGKPKHAFSTPLDKRLLERHLPKDSIRPFAIHLHAHNFATAISLTISGKVFAEINPFHGYGPDQTFFYVNEESFSTADVVLTCVYNSTAATHAIEHGISNGDEMCGFALLYTSNVQTDTTNMLMI